MTLNLIKNQGTADLAGFTDSRHQPKLNLGNIKATQEANAMLDLLCEVGKKVGSVSKLEKLVENVTRMTQHTLEASASSVLLFDDGKRELFFEIAEGKARRALKQIRLGAQSGIAGWVARYGKPLIVNDVTRDQRFDRSIDEITGFVTNSVICVPLVVRRKVIGVIEVLNKLDGSDFSTQDLRTLTSVASTAAMAIENTKLHQTVMEAYKSTIMALAAAIDAKDYYTRGHSQRVMEYALLAGTSLSLLEHELEVLQYASILHDIGKIGIADNILNKPKPLTDREWEIMVQHPEIGTNILKDIPFLEEARTLILHHHERYDGSGYPDGLNCNDIPLGSRLIAVADAFDTMTTERSYRVSLSVDHAIEELYRSSGTQFCPIAVDAFVSGYNTQSEKLPTFETV